MQRNTSVLVSAVVTCLLLTATSAYAAGSNIAVIRAESVDAMLSDLDRVLQAAGVDFSADSLLPLVQGSLGLPDLDWVDRSRPLALVFPTAALSYGAKGMVGALPVTDVDAASRALDAAFADGETDDEGIRRLALEDGTTVYVESHGDYLVVGQQRELVSTFDLAAAIDVPDLPAGSIALDLDLEAIAPLAMMGLQVARQMATDQIISGQLPGFEGDTEDGDEQEGDDREMSPQAAGAVVDLVLQLFQDLLNNVSRFQLAIEVTDRHVAVHSRLIPRGGSTLAGLVQAQRGAGLPDIARYLPAGDEMVLAAGQLSFTEAFIEALAVYAEKYAGVMGGMTDGGAAGGEFNWLGSSIEMMSTHMDEWIECSRGDFAGAFGLADGGMRITQLVGLTKGKKCRKLFADMARMASQIEGPDGEPMVTVQEDALQHRGVSAMRQQLTLPMVGLDEESEEIVHSMLGDGEIVSYVGVAGNLALTVSGTGADQRFRELVDRVKGRPSDGLTDATFAPLEPGPGVAIALDFGAVFRSLGRLGLDEESTLEALGELPAEDSRLVFGIGFEAGAVTSDLAVPLALVEAIGEAVAADEPAPQHPSPDRS